MFTIQQQIASVKRELKMRDLVYKARVELGKMTQQQSDLEIGAMKAVLETLQDVEEKTRLI